MAMLQSKSHSQKYVITTKTLHIGYLLDIFNNKQQQKLLISGLFESRSDQIRVDAIPVELLSRNRFLFVSFV